MGIKKPLCIDLYAGLGGWAEGFLAEGYNVIGFDIERHDYGTGGYPGQLVIQDVLTLHGSQFRDAAVIVASPPCQKYSYFAMPWSRAKTIAAEYRSGVRDVKQLTALFDVCFRIQREACEATGHHIPMIVENVRGAIPWVGQSRWHYGSFHMWGDVPALMPITNTHKSTGGSWFCQENSPGTRGTGDPRDVRRNESGEWVSVGGIKLPGNNGSRRWEDREVKRLGDALRDNHGVKQEGSGEVWYDIGVCKLSSRSSARKAASAQIAKIPFPLARHIARCFK